MTSNNVGFCVSAAKEESPCRVTLEDFERIKFLGEGGFGRVYLVRKRGGVDNGTFYALKVIQKSKIVKNSKTVEHTMAERHILGKIDEAPFLVKLHYSFQTKRNLYLVLDYLEGGDMFELLNKRERFTEKESRLYIAEIILAIEKLHKMGIIYRDLKPENILLDCAGHIVVADYGLCKAFLPHEKVDRTYSFCGTKEYMAPEIIKDEGHNMAVDWWTVGILMFEMLTGATPFEVIGDENKLKLYNRIVTDTPIMPMEFSSHARDFILRLLDKDPNKRLGGGTNDALEVKSHPFFNGLNWTHVAQKITCMPYLPPTNCDVVDSTNQDWSMELLPPEPSTKSQKCGDPFKDYSFVSAPLAMRASHSSAPADKVLTMDSTMKMSLKKKRPLKRKYPDEKSESAVREQPRRFCKKPKAAN
jgi:ribosomal protein S6 kinase alpha-5